MGIEQIRQLKLAAASKPKPVHKGTPYLSKQPGKTETKKCLTCGKDFTKRKAHGKKNIFCSVKCRAEKAKNKDGLTKGQRQGRKNGCIPRGSKEFSEMMSARTKEGMSRPEVLEKLRRAKGPMSTEQKMVISNKMIGMMPKNLGYANNGSFPNVQRGEYECSKGSVYFRSKWEANYSLYLDFLQKNRNIKEWEYEADTFFFDKIKLGTRSYRPDFKVFNHDGSFEYHEVKGYMDSRSKTKLKRMAKYFPDVKLILIDKAFYNDLYKKFKTVLKFY